jgi:hypothetical protein
MVNYKALFQFLLIAVIVAACNNVDTPKQDSKDDTVSFIPQQVETPKTIAEEFTPAGDSIILPPFEVTVQLSGKAREKLAASNETIIVSAILSGIPKDTTMKEYQEWGEFALGHVEVEIPEPGTASFTNAKILKSDYDLLASKDIQVLINVYSGRKSTGDNLLDCEILQEPISKVRQQKNILNGKLIGE